METLLQKGLSATKESRFVEFKVSFDPSDNGEWCELIKDIVAIANTGDGVIFIGLDNDGVCSDLDVSKALNIDPAEITDKIFRYTREQLGGIELMRMEKNGQPVAAILITGLLEPIVFEKPGNYQRRNGQSACAFAIGSLYFRHSAKSQPATNDDIRRVIKRNLDLLRKEMMRGVSKVVKAPLGSTLTIPNGEVSESNSPSATPIRLVDDESAPAYRKLDPDETHPHRQTELVEILNKKLEDAGLSSVNSYDVLAVRQTHNTDDDYRFTYNSRFGPRQYSCEFVNWLVEQAKSNPLFFQTARDLLKALRRNRATRDGGQQS